MTPEKIGRYEIKSEIGRGGMAIVYLARDPRTDRDVAIKVLPREFLFDPQFHVRFQREIKTVAQLEHPAIVPIHDVGEEEGQPYFVMRYMTGGTLATWLKHGKISLQDTARIVERLAKALNYAHSKGIIHRDLKPGNVLFDGNNEAFISDFGVAKLADAATNMTGSGVIGTPAYMSPEQAQSLHIDGRSDVYALGAIIYEMLTGQQPYKADTPMSVILKHLTEPVPEITRNYPEFSEEVDAVIKKSMHKDPDQRYASTIELARALNKAAFGEEGHLTELAVTRPFVSAPAEILANSMAATLAPNNTPLVTTPPPVAAPQRRNWLGIGLGILAIIIILSLSVMLFLREEAAEVAPTPLPAMQTPIIITATPLPATDTPVPLPTETLLPATLAVTPSFDATLIQFGVVFEGTTLSNSQMLAFNGQEGTTVDIVLTGVNHYQTFSIRNEQNEGLVGCNIDSRTICSIKGFKLPYTGLFYVLVDRTRDPRYENNSNCLNAGANAWAWCFISGPYSLILTSE